MHYITSQNHVLSSKKNDPDRTLTLVLHGHMFGLLGHLHPAQTGPKSFQTAGVCLGSRHVITCNGTGWCKLNLVTTLRYINESTVI